MLRPLLSDLCRVVIVSWKNENYFFKKRFMSNAKNQRTGREVKMLCEQTRQTTEKQGHSGTSKDFTK